MTATAAMMMIVARAGALMLFATRYQAARNPGYLVLMAFVVVPVALIYAARAAFGAHPPTAATADAVGAGIDIISVALAAAGAWMVERGSPRAGRARQ